MIDYINEALSFDFVIDTYIPFFLKAGLISLIGVGIVIVFVVLNTINNEILKKITNKIAFVVGIVTILLIVIALILITVFPVLTCTIALKLFLMQFIHIPEVVMGIISAIICTIAFYLISKVISA